MYNHPCFNAEVSHLYGRVHLPVAPDCNIKCNFCNRKYDCVNENRPGVTSAILSPQQSIRYLETVMLRKPNISVIGIAGPGEPFANPENTLKTLSLVREKLPDILLCVATNGLNVLSYLDELIRLGMKHITITVNAVKPEIGAKVYSWVRYKKKIYRGIEAATILRFLQLEAIKRLKEHNIIVKINTILIPGINDTHIIDVAKKVAALGADVLNCIPLCPSEDTPFESIKEPDNKLVAQIRKEAESYIPQMYHCRRCRADAAGLLGEDLNNELILSLQECSRMPLDPEEKRFNIAVATKEGLLINQHLGEATQLRIYRPLGNKFDFLETRKTPEPGSGVKRWLDLAQVLSDCHSILVGSAGHTPQEILKLKGIRVLETEGVIDDILDKISQGIDMDTLEKKTGCNFGCSGQGRGCG